ncbi:MAG: dihydroorotate dehydrogenase [Candidatus Odinarchaeota archaeon]|nr:dihydroorotate dehydrogenase [Candidatus Odinarchaeota archaeon]
MSVEISGIELESPTILASGILGMSAESLTRVAMSGAGAVVTKSVGPYPREGYRGPNVIEVDCGYINAMGLPNPGVEYFLEEIREYKKSCKKPIIVSIFGRNEEEYAFVSSKVSELGVDGIEINVSCPHSEEGVLNIGLSPEHTYKVTKSVREKVREKIPILVKLPGNTNIPNLLEVAKSAVKAGADGIVAINTIPAIWIDVDVMKPVIGNVYGGLSGPAIRPIALRIVYELYEELNVPIIGVGGVVDWKAAIQYFLAGASAVEIGSGIAYKDIGIFDEVNDGIRRYLMEKNFKDLNEIIGVAHR